MAASETILERLRLFQCVVREEKVVLFRLRGSMLRIPIVSRYLGTYAIIGCEIGWLCCGLIMIGIYLAKTSNITGDC